MIVIGSYANSQCMRTCGCYHQISRIRRLISHYYLIYRSHLVIKQAIFIGIICGQLFLRRVLILIIIFVTFILAPRDLLLLREIFEQLIDLVSENQVDRRHDRLQGVVQDPLIE